MHLKPKSAEVLNSFGGQCPVTIADIVKTGFYILPTHPLENCIKIATHTEGYPMQGVNITAEELEKKLREVLSTEVPHFRKFLKE